MTWEEARQEALRQWGRAGEQAAAHDMRGFAHAVNRCTALCDKAREECEREGVPATSRCYFCLHLSPHKHCQRIFTDLIVTALDGDWAAVESEVARILHDLRALRVPAESPA